MAYLTDDKKHLILTCNLCGGEVRYRTGYPHTAPDVAAQLEKVLSVWQERAETCDACLLGPTGATPDVKPCPDDNSTVDPQIPQPDKTTAPAPVIEVNWNTSVPLKDNTPPRMYDVRECQALLRISRGRALKFIREEIIPLGGCVRVGNRYLVHAWALNHALSLRTLQKKPKQIYSPARLASLKLSKRRKSSRHISSETPSLPSGEKS